MNKIGLILFLRFLISGFIFFISINGLMIETFPIKTLTRFEIVANVTLKSFLIYGH